MTHDPLCGGAWRCTCDGPTCERPCPAEMFCQCELISRVREDERKEYDEVMNLVSAFRRAARAMQGSCSVTRIVSHPTSPGEQKHEP